MIFNRFDVVTVDFPFADLGVSRVRPALVLTSHEDFSAHANVVLLAMITTAKRSSWPHDVNIADLRSAGLRIPCLVRMKLISVVLPRIKARIGTLSEVDGSAVAKSITNLFRLA